MIQNEFRSKFDECEKMIEEILNYVEGMEKRYGKKRPKDELDKIREHVKELKHHHQTETMKDILVLREKIEEVILISFRLPLMRMF